MSNTKLQNNIMRRVYYAFAIKLATHTATKHVVVLAVLGYVLTKLVFVAKVYENLASRELGELAPTLVRILSNADLVTLVVVGLVIFTALSLPLRIVVPERARMQFA